MSARYDVYGFEKLNLDEAARVVESILGITLERRDSSYWGIYYCSGKGPGRDFMLYKNDEGEWHTPKHKVYGVILLVNALDNMDEIQHKLTSGRIEPILLSTAIHPKLEPDEGAIDTYDG